MKNELTTLNKDMIEHVCILVQQDTGQYLESRVFLNCLTQLEDQEKRNKFTSEVALFIERECAKKPFSNPLRQGCLINDLRTCLEICGLAKELLEPLIPPDCKRKGSPFDSNDNLVCR